MAKSRHGRDHKKRKEVFKQRQKQQQNELKRMLMQQYMKQFEEIQQGDGNITHVEEAPEIMGDFSLEETTTQMPDNEDVVIEDMGIEVEDLGLEIDDLEVVEIPFDPEKKEE